FGSGGDDQWRVLCREDALLGGAIDGVLAGHGHEAEHQQREWAERHGADGTCQSTLPARREPCSCRRLRSRVPGRMQSLRDKLLKAGLVTEDQALKAESKIVVKRAPPPSPSELEGKRRSEGGRGRPSGDRGRAGEGRGRPPGGRRERSPSANIPKLPPMPGSRAYQQAESRRQLEQAKAQRELVLAHQVEIDVGATVFYFMTRKKLLRRLELTEAQAAELEAGRLAVVERPDPDRIEHALVPAAAADALLEKFPKAVRFYNRADQPIGFMSDDEIQRR